MTSRVCPGCGLPLLPDAQSCPGCGSSLAATGLPAKTPARRLNRRFAFVAALLALGAVGVGAAAILLLSGGGSGDGSGEMARTLVTKLAARDATASTLVESDVALRKLAGEMGLVELPGSVTVSVANVVATAADPSPATAASAGDKDVSVTYTLKWSGQGHSGQVDQKLTATAHKGADGNAKLIDVAVSPPLPFDAGVYFGTGTSAEDAGKVADDLKAGSGWLSGVSVVVSPSDEVLTVPEVDTPVPGHLTTWRQTESPAVPGNKTSWRVRVTADGDSFLSFVQGSRITVEPVAARVQVGTLSPESVASQVSSVDGAFWAAIKAGNIKTANAYISKGTKISATGASLMKSWANLSADLAATEGSNGPEVKFHGLTFVLGSDGTWTIDSSRSHLVMASVPSAASLHRLVYSQISGGRKVCSSNITVEMKFIEFYTDGKPPSAVFKFTHNGNCPSTDRILSVKVNWLGNPGVQIDCDIPGTDATASGPVYRYVPLADGMSPTKLPIWVAITKYGDPNGGMLPLGMAFCAN